MNSTKNASVKAIQHKDVFGKILHYLHIVTELGEIFINIGQKTYDTINKLNGNDGPTLTVTEIATTPTPAEPANEKNQTTRRK